MHNSWGKQEANQKASKEKLRSEMSIGHWEVPTHFWESRRPHTYVGLCMCPGLCVHSGKTWEGTKLSILDDFEALHEEEVKAKWEF